MEFWMFSSCLKLGRESSVYTGRWSLSVSHPHIHEIYTLYQTCVRCHSVCLILQLDMCFLLVQPASSEQHEYHTLSREKNQVIIIPNGTIFTTRWRLALQTNVSTANSHRQHTTFFTLHSGKHPGRPLQEKLCNGAENHRWTAAFVCKTGVNVCVNNKETGICSVILTKAASMNPITIWSFPCMSQSLYSWYFPGRRSGLLSLQSE